MRPTKLTMSAFGPYKDKAVLDMNSLGVQGIYLITGETGAGKTTIFDAIVYALYGKTSGDDSTSRDEKMIRSEYADDTTPTFVEMEFEVRGKSYRIKRNPEYRRPKSRGEGFTTESAGVEFCLPDGSYAKGTVTSINEQIVEVIRVDKNQFCKLAMLAQGDFQKFLLDTTKNKTAILRKIFSTDIFEQVQNILKSDVGEISKAYQQLNREVEIFLNDVSFAVLDQSEIDFANAKSTVEKKEILEAYVEKENLNKARLKDEANSLDNEIKQINERISAAKRRAELLEKQSSIRQQISEKEKELAQLKVKNDEAQKLSERQEVIIRETGRYKEALNKLEALKTASAELERINKEIKQQADRRSALKTELDNINKALSGMKDIDAVIADAEKEKARLENIGKVLKNYLDSKNEKERFTEKLIPIQKKCTAASENYDQAYSLYINEQAGILAQQLRDDKPCPVCGSLTHPAPAALHEQAPDKDELERLRKIRDDAEAKRKDILISLELADKRIEDSAGELETLIGSGSYDEALREKIRNEFAEQRNIIRAQEERKREKLLLEKELPKKESEVEKLTELLLSLEGKRAAAQEKVNSASTEHSDENEIRNKINELSKQYDEIKSAIENAANAYNSCKELYSRLVGNDDAIGKELESIPQDDTDMALLTEKLSALESKKGELSRNAEELSNRLNVNEKILKKLQGHIEEIAKVEKELMWKKSLSDTANGTIADGKHRKITLENYVLCEYFKRILNRASARLMVMSSGQYDLVLQNDESNHKSQVGLDVGVIDHYNGSIRSVRSLSGGEKFMASLCLALGLSDEVQSSSGGIQLDTMFVDEGFGSLDSNTLELAMRALNSLADSNRLVGIISHVDALESRISRQIVVTKSSACGSSAKIVV